MTKGRRKEIDEEGDEQGVRLKILKEMTGAHDRHPSFVIEQGAESN